jgi:O-antigen/teichoic acid export membrane protein
VHWARIVRNIFSNWASYLVTAVVGFVLAPVVVHSLGDAGYGLWTLIISMTGYFGLLDLGIRSSVGRFVTRYLAWEDERNVNRIASTAFVILGIAGALAFAATLILAVWLFGSLKISPEYRAIGRLALVITGLNMSCALPLGVFSAVLIGQERFDIVSGVTIVGELARAVLVVSLLRHGYGLVALALIALGVTVVEYGAMAVMAKRLYRPLRIRIGLADRAAFRELFGFSIYRFIWIVANQLIFYSDAVVIGIYLGPAAVTPYAIAGSLINYARNIVSLVTDALGPAASRMDANHDFRGLQNLLVVGTRVALIVAFPLCVGLFFLGRQFITLWMGPAYAGSAVFLMVLTIPQLSSMSQYASAFVLTGMARHRALAVIVMIEGLANLVLSIVLVQRMGLIGVAWGTVIPHLISTTIVVPLYTLRTLKMDVRRYLVEAFVRPALTALPIVAIGYAFSQLDVQSWLMFLAEAFCLCATFGAICSFSCFDGRQRAAVRDRIAALVRREVVVHEA